MAIAPKDRYNANQIDTSDPTNYPQGKAKNISALGNTDGSPFEKDMLNDIWGFQQAILKAGGTGLDTPSGQPDSALLSQYLIALRASLQGAVAEIYQDPSTQQIVIPDYITDTSQIEIYGVGAGGGGGGCDHTGTSSAITAGGGGGGSGNGFHLTFTGAQLPPGTVLEFTPGTMGAGGFGGQYNTSATDGSSGGDTNLVISAQNIDITAQGGFGGTRGYFSGTNPISGRGGGGWCGGGGASSVAPVAANPNNGTGGTSYTYDTRKKGYDGIIGWTEPYTNATGTGGMGGAIFDNVSPGVQLIRGRIQYFGNGSDGGFRQGFGTNKHGAAGGGGGASPMPFFQDPTTSSYNSQNGDLQPDAGSSEYWQAQGKRGHGPGGGGGGGGTWFLSSNFGQYPGGRGAGGAIYIKYS